MGVLSALVSPSHITTVASMLAVRLIMHLSSCALRSSSSTCVPNLLILSSFIEPDDGG